MANFLVSYALFSTRGIKVMLGFDHNVCPREDVVKYGDRLVEKGEISRPTLNMIKRWEAAHANAVENFPLFFGAVLFALHSGVPYGTINGLAASYTLSRMAYVVAYISIDQQIYSWSRSVLWWCGNISCLALIKMAGSRL